MTSLRYRPTCSTLLTCWLSVEPACLSGRFSDPLHLDREIVDIGQIDRMTATNATPEGVLVAAHAAVAHRAQRR